MAMEGDNFGKIGYSLGAPDSGFSIFLADRTKKVHFIRHAEGVHNVASRETGSNDCLQDMKYWDAPLTDTGIEQCKRLRRELAVRPSQGRKFTHFDLVIVSPLTRTLQSADYIFGPPRKPGIPAILAERFENSELPRPKFLVREECRERISNACDGRRPVRELMKEFPDFDFSEVESDEDIYYSPVREPSDHVSQRSIAFLEWLNKRPEKCVAVVTHSSFLRHLFDQFGGDKSAEVTEINYP